MGVLLETRNSTTGSYAANEMQTLFRPLSAGNSLSGVKCLLAIHGRGGTALQPHKTPGWYRIIRALTDAGYAVLSIDCAAQSGGAGTTDANRYTNPWGNDAAMTAIANARTWLTGQGAASKIGFLDYSLGGGQGFNYGSRNPNNVSGIITFCGAYDYDWFWTNKAFATAELEDSYASAHTTTSGSGTLNQVGSNLTLTGALAGQPASGTVVLYPITTQGLYVDPVIVTYTGGGGTTTLTGCTIASGSLAWGTGSVFTGVSPTGGYATNKATRSPLLIASNPAFDTWPMHCYLAADDATVGPATTPIQSPSMSVAFCNAVGSNAVFHSVRGAQYATTNTTLAESKTLNAVGTTLNLASINANWAASGNAVIETGDQEPLVIAYTGKAGNQLTGVTAVVPTSKAVTTGSVIYASGLGGHSSIFDSISESEILGIVKKFTW